VTSDYNGVYNIGVTQGTSHGSSQYALMVDINGNGSNSVYAQVVAPICASGVSLANLSFSAYVMLTATRGSTFPSNNEVDVMVQYADGSISNVGYTTAITENSWFLLSAGLTASTKAVIGIIINYNLTGGVYWSGSMYIDDVVIK
jgi:hypothetical protein